MSKYFIVILIIFVSECFSTESDPHYKICYFRRCPLETQKCKQSIKSTNHGGDVMADISCLDANHNVLKSYHETQKSSTIHDVAFDSYAKPVDSSDCSKSKCVKD